MTRIYRWSMMVYSSLQAEFMVTKYECNSVMEKMKFAMSKIKVNQ